jgi:PAS domain S-box-containing protein
LWRESDYPETAVKKRTGARVSFNSRLRREIARRKRVEGDLIESEQRFRAVFEWATEGILVADIRTKKFVDGNRAICRMLGYDLEEIKTLVATDIHPKEELPRVLEDFDKFIRGKPVLTKGSRVRRKDGSIFFADISAYPLKIDGKTYVAGVFRDVTEPRRTEQALRESEQRFRALVETTSDFVWEVDRNCFYTYASPRVKDLLGYNPEEVVGKMPFDLMPRDEADRVAKAFRDITKSGKPFANLENTNLHKDGRCVVLETSGVPIFDARGNLAGYRGIDRDITARKQAEQNYRSMFENAVVGIYQSTPQGRFLAVNPAFARILGYESPRQIIEMAGGAAQRFYVDKRKRRAFERLLSLHGEVHDLEFQAYRRDGMKIWIKENARAVRDSKGRVACYEGFVEDITVQKDAEEALDQAAQRVIEAQEAERKRVAHGLHDSVSQLLSSARFRLASVGKKISGQTQKSYPELDDSLRLIEKAVQEIRTIIHNLRPTVLDDLGLLPAVRTLCEEFRERANIKLKFRSTRELTRFAPEIELALFRIVQEALHNIEKHSQATRVSVILLQKRAEFQIKVKDNGIGFDHLAASKNRGKFSGYGLPFILERAKSIGGKVEILSAVDKGSEVIVRIPLNGSGRCD